MAFVLTAGKVVSFAEFDDVQARDQLLFVVNESLKDGTIDVDACLVRATERILSKIRNSDWWRSYFVKRDQSSLRTVADIPALDANLILSRHNDFNDLCVYTALAEYILPAIANFGTEDNAERQKMGYYDTKASDLLAELLVAGDWYDFDNSGVITSDEKDPGTHNPRRIR